jgi:hypothetical protein
LEGTKEFLGGYQGIPWRGCGNSLEGVGILWRALGILKEFLEIHVYSKIKDILYNALVNY